MQVIVVFLLIYGLSLYLSEYNPSNLSQSAFCKVTSSYSNRNFPIDLPEQHLPWIWDAVYDPITEMVELTTMSRSPCEFDKVIWRDLLHTFPQYSNQLGYGLDSNILVPADSNITDDDLLYHLHGSFVICEFLLDGKLKKKLSIRSLKIRGQRVFSSLGTTQIRCPVKRTSSWDQIRIRLHPHRVVYLHNIFSNVTNPVSVCRLPEYSSLKKMYDLTVCSATSRANREHLVEWIEYNRLLGVQHLYLYNTIISYQHRHDLSSILSDYINQGLVTIIPWHYHNCVRGMAGGRWSLWFINDVRHNFKSPRAIAQSAALASCYARFKHTSKYMMHIDDDEFMSYSREKMSISLGSPINNNMNLVQVADMIFQKHMKSSAIRFEPVQYTPCALLPPLISYNRSNSLLPPSASSQRLLPRVNRWILSEPADAYEGKLLMRCDRIGMFFVHYISLLEAGPWTRQEDKAFVSYPLTHLCMLHYKYPPSLSYNILEELLPITENSFPGSCHWTRQQGYHDKKDYHAMMPRDFMQTLQHNYKQRIQIM